MSRRFSWFVSGCAFSAALFVVASGRTPTAVGQPKPLGVPAPPQAPTLTSPANLGTKRGGAVDLVFTGTNLNDPTGVLFSGPGKASLVPDVKDAKPDPAKVKV